jgi:hypothetical protein
MGVTTVSPLLPFPIDAGLSTLQWVLLASIHLTDYKVDRSWHNYMEWHELSRQRARGIHNPWFTSCQASIDYGPESLGRYTMHSLSLEHYDDHTIPASSASVQALIMFVTINRRTTRY